MTSTKQPKIVGYMSALYDKMASEAAEIKPENGEVLLVWQGRLIDTCNSVGIPTGYYKKVVDALRGLHCIEVISRGTRGATLTTIALGPPPALESYQEAIVKSGWEGLTDVPSLDRVWSQVREILKTVGGIDIRGVFMNHENRITKLETALKVLEQQVSKANKTNNT